MKGIGVISENCFLEIYDTSKMSSVLEGALGKRPTWFTLLTCPKSTPNLNQNPVSQARAGNPTKVYCISGSWTKVLPPPSSNMKSLCLCRSKRITQWAPESSTPACRICYWFVRRGLEEDTRATLGNLHQMAFHPLQTLRTLRTVQSCPEVNF